jgi:glycosyltransferase involved in cell wall biosynthesis
MLSDHPLVSIVMPSYNQGRFIEQTIESMLSQDHPNIEYIVMNGGSSDNALAVLGKYEGRLRWSSEPDEGQKDVVSIVTLSTVDLVCPGRHSQEVKRLTRENA